MPCQDLVKNDSWADIMDHEEAGGEGVGDFLGLLVKVQPAADERDREEEDDDPIVCRVKVQPAAADGCDREGGTEQRSSGAWDDILSRYPVPGELFVHLMGSANYYSALLQNNPPPAYGEPPYVVNSWQHAAVPSHSPYRVQYGTSNPALRGLVVTPTAVVPNFGWTPRLALETEHLVRLAEEPASSVGIALGDPAVVVVPAVHGRVLRLFFAEDPEDAVAGGHWYVANHQRVERVRVDEPRSVDAGGLLRHVFETCLVRYYSRSLHQFTEELRRDLCWFFGTYPNRRTLLFLGTCRILSHGELMQELDPGPEQLDLGFSPHGHLPPSVPILPEQLPSGSRMRLGMECLENAHIMQYTDLFDGLLLLNTRTMFALRLCYPNLVFLTPLLKHRMPLCEFLAVRIVQAQLLEMSQATVDQDSHDWYRSMGNSAEVFFGEQHGHLIDRIQWQVANISAWLPGWMAHISNLRREDWSALDVDLQRMYVLLGQAALRPLRRAACCGLRGAAGVVVQDTLQPPLHPVDRQGGGVLSGAVGSRGGGGWLTGQAVHSVPFFFPAVGVCER